MKRMMIPVITIALVMCAGKAEAVIGALSHARASLHSARMSAYGAQIRYHQGAAYHYSTQMFGLTARKYGYGGSSRSSYGISRYSPIRSYGGGRTSLSSGVPTYSTFTRAAGASSTSSLMAIIGSWGH